MEKNFKEINPELKGGDVIMLLHMEGEPIPTGSLGIVKGKIDQPRFSSTDPGYGYAVEWYDKDTNKFLSKLPLFPEADGWVFNKEYYKSNPENIQESMFKNIDDLIEWGDFLSLFGKSELKVICELFELERRSGFSNMYTEGGRFLLTGPEYIKDFIRLQSYQKEFNEEDEEIHELILSRAQEVRDIFIRNSMKYLENKGQEVEIPKVQIIMRRLARTAKKYWFNNTDKFLNKEIK
jgi:hypothetical protein